MTNPFDAAIAALEGEESALYQPGLYEDAIRLLGAAGELTDKDKAWLLSKVDWAIAEYVPAIEGMVCPGAAMKDRFRVLLAALPDKVTP